MRRGGRCIHAANMLGSCDSKQPAAALLTHQYRTWPRSTALPWLYSRVSLALLPRPSRKGTCRTGDNSSRTCVTCECRVEKFRRTLPWLENTPCCVWVTPLEGGSHSAHKGRDDGVALGGLQPAHACRGDTLVVPARRQGRHRQAAQHMQAHRWVCWWRVRVRRTPVDWPDVQLPCAVLVLRYGVGRRLGREEGELGCDRVHKPQRQARSRGRRGGLSLPLRPAPGFAAGCLS
jgi:hypothetical protein